MDTLGKTDLLLLYNRERRRIIEDDQERDRKTARIMREGIAQAPDLMNEETVRKFEEICENCMYKALKKLQIKYFGQDNDCHTWIGINPCVLGDKSPQLKKLWDKTKNLMGRYKCIPNEGIAFCVERNVSNGIRPHIHLMVIGRQEDRPAHIAKTLAKYYGCPQNLINVKKFTKKTMFKEHMDYIKGIKRDIKQPQVIADKKDRIAEGVPDYFLDI